MEYTTAHLAAIRAAIATGELSVSIDGRTVTYHSKGDLIKAERHIESKLAAAGAVARPVTQSYVARVRT